MKYTKNQRITPHNVTVEQCDLHRRSQWVKKYSRRWQTSPPVPPPGEMGGTYTLCVVFYSGPFAPLRENMTSATKPKVHNVSHCRQRRTKPWWNLDMRFTGFWDMWADRQTDMLTAVLCTHTRAK